MQQTGLLLSKDKDSKVQLPVNLHTVLKSHYSNQIGDSFQINGSVQFDVSPFEGSCGGDLNGRSQCVKIYRAYHALSVYHPSKRTWDRHMVRFPTPMEWPPNAI